MFQWATWPHILPFWIRWSSCIGEGLLVAGGAEASEGRGAEELGAESAHEGGLFGAGVLLNVH